MRTLQIAVGGIAALVLLGGAYQAGRTQNEAPVVAVAGAADLPLLSAAAGEPVVVAAKPVPVAGKTQTQTHTPAQNAPAPAAEPKLCAECATVVDVHSEHREGKASGLGAIGGALLGGVLGHQVGGGTGKKLATVAGAAAGGFAGNQVEKSQTARQVWMVRVSYPDGDKRSFEFDQRPDFRVNTVVRVHNGVLERY